MEIFQITKAFPPEERFALTGQIRRSSRSVCLNLREACLHAEVRRFGTEAWAKRRYEAHFVRKLIPTCRDDGENSETDSSLDFARDCAYISDEQHKGLTDLCAEVGKMLGSMIVNPMSFLIRD